MSWSPQPTSSSPSQDPHANQRLLAAGAELAKASIAMIMVHGRGAGPSDILGLSRALRGEGIRFLAPEAADWSWYPQSFMAPREANEPFVTSALENLSRLVDQLEDGGLPSDRIVLMGFSQGACLSLELAARRPRRYAGVVAYSGGLIGAQIDPSFSNTAGGNTVADGNTDGGLAGTPVFLGCSDRDPHIPLGRVQESTVIMKALGGEVTERIYPGMPHTINPDEIEWLQVLLDSIG